MTRGVDHPAHVELLIADALDDTDLDESDRAIFTAIQTILRSVRKTGGLSIEQANHALLLARAGRPGHDQRSVVGNRTFQVEAGRIQSRRRAVRSAHARRDGRRDRWRGDLHGRTRHPAEYGDELRKYLLAQTITSGDLDVRYEPDTATRLASVFNLSPSTTYHWKATWGSEFRLVVLEGGADGSQIYNIGVGSPNGIYAPNPHYAFLGAPTGRSGDESASTLAHFIATYGSRTGRGRPASLGSALRQRRRSGVSGLGRTAVLG